MTGRSKAPHGGRDGDDEITSANRAPENGETSRPRRRSSIGSVARAQEAVADVARAGRARIEAGGLVESDATLSHGGHSSRPTDVFEFERQDRWANAAYDDIRANPDADAIAANLRDVDRIDGSAGFSADEINRIRDHVFFEEHPLSDYDGGIVHRRYDASADMAEAWLRLRSGRPLPEDIALLEHESAEARYYDTHPGSTYEEAHRAANGVSNWQNQIPAPTDEDYTTPWRQPWG